MLSPNRSLRALLQEAERVSDTFSWMPIRVAEAIRRIEAEGWTFVAQRGSHRQYKHPSKPGRVTIPGRLNDELNPKTWRSILKQAGLTDE